MTKTDETEPGLAAEIYYPAPRSIGFVDPESTGSTDDDYNNR